MQPQPKPCDILLSFPRPLQKDTKVTYRTEQGTTRKGTVIDAGWYVLLVRTEAEALQYIYYRDLVAVDATPA